ncbi:hypothetical protein ACLB2K_002337 [Fragaria x ananassa]
MDWALGYTVETESESFELESNSNSDSEDQDVEVDSESALAENSLIPATKEPTTTTPSPSTMTSLPPKPQKRSRKSSSATSSSGSRERSMVWEHYEKFERPVYEYKDGKKVLVSNEPRAKCRYCSKDLACNTYNNGTSSLKRHIENVCKRYPGRTDLEQHQKVFVAGGKLSEPTLGMTAFDEDSILKACVEMIVIDEMPFNSTEKPGFKRFCRAACPRFKVPGRGLVVNTFWEIKKVWILDVPTRWNSTFLMLDTALQLRKAFDRMAEEEDSKYRSYFDEEDEFTDDEAADEPDIADAALSTSNN